MGYHGRFEGQKTPKPKKKAGKVILIIVLVLVLLVGAAAAWGATGFEAVSQYFRKTVSTISAKE